MCSVLYQELNPRGCCAEGVCIKKSGGRWQVYGGGGAFLSFSPSKLIPGGG